MSKKKKIATSLAAVAIIASGTLLSNHAFASTRKAEFASSTELQTKYNKQNKTVRVHIKGYKFMKVSGKVLSISNTTLTVQGSSTTYVIDGSMARVTDNSKKAGDIENILVNDTVTAFGHFATSTNILTARFIGDTSRTF